MTALRKGIYRIELPGLGECARVHPNAGDAGPFLERPAYETLGFQPPYEQLREAAASDLSTLAEVWRS